MRSDYVSIFFLKKINACGSLKCLPWFVMEQRLNIKFRIGKMARENHEFSKTPYGDIAMSHSRTFEQYARFHDGKEIIEDDQRRRRPITKRTENEVVKVRTLMTADRRNTIRMVADELNIGKDKVHKILRDNLGETKICS